MKANVISILRLTLVLGCLLLSHSLHADIRQASDPGRLPAEDPAGDEFDLSMDEMAAESAEDLAPAEVEVISAVELEERVELQAPMILGFRKALLLTGLGVTTWCLLVLAIWTRLIRLPGRARLLLRLHKVFAYLAFLLATVHGYIGLFL